MTLNLICILGIMKRNTAILGEARMGKNLSAKIMMIGIGIIGMINMRPMKNGGIRNKGTVIVMAATGMTEGIIDFKNNPIYLNRGMGLIRVSSFF